MYLPLDTYQNYKEGEAFSAVNLMLDRAVKSFEKSLSFYLGDDYESFLPYLKFNMKFIFIENGRIDLCSEIFSISETPKHLLEKYSKLSKKYYSGEPIDEDELKEMREFYRNLITKDGHAVEVIKINGY